MKLSIAVAIIAFVPTLAFADVDDNVITIDNSGVATATGGSGEGGGFLGIGGIEINAGGATAAGVDIKCGSGASCSRNTIAIDNSGVATATGDAVAAGVRIQAQ